MEALFKRRSQADYGLRQHSTYSKVARSAACTAVGGASLFVGSLIREILSDSSRNFEKPVTALNISIIAAFVALQSRKVRTGVEAALRNQHALHPGILNGVFEEMKDDLCQRTHAFVQDLNDNDGGTMVITD